MSHPIHHHPSDETLARHAAGTLPAGPALVVEAHLALCRDCRRQVALLEAVGGALLDEQEPEALSDDALAHVLALIERPGESRVATPAPPQPNLALPAGIALPEALGGHEIGGWRRLAPGIRISKVRDPHSQRTDALLLRIGPGRKLPLHSHSGHEYTLVLGGSFSDSRGHYRAGDLDEADAAVEHRPVADRDGDCFCLVAVEGEMRMRSLLARLVQPFAGL